ncbi:MAG: hypothetical protein ACM3TT_05500 [Syntrophothermus sp.]
MAHAGVTGNGLVRALVFLGGFAPVLFFAVSGVTTVMQAGRKRLPVVILTYGFLFFLGLALNALSPDPFVSNIIQCVSLSVILLAVGLQYMKPELLGITFLVPFLIHLARPEDLPYPIAGFLFERGWFPLFPWLSFFLLGMWWYFEKNFARKFLGLAGGIALLTVAYLNGGNFTSKYDMSVGYFALSYLGVIIIFTLAKYYGKHTESGFTKLARGANLRRLWRGSALLPYIGRHSLLFLFAHYLIIFSLGALDIDLSAGNWFMILILAPPVMYAAQFLNSLTLQKWGTPHTYWFWAILALSTLLNLLAINIVPKTATFGFSLLLGFIISCNYHSLSVVIEKAVTRKIHSRRILRFFLP